MFVKEKKNVRGRKKHEGQGRKKRGKKVKEMCKGNLCEKFTVKLVGKF